MRHTGPAEPRTTLVWSVVWTRISFALGTHFRSFLPLSLLPLRSRRYAGLLLRSRSRPALAPSFSSVLASSFAGLLLLLLLLLPPLRRLFLLFLLLRRSRLRLRLSELGLRLLRRSRLRLRSRPRSRLRLRPLLRKHPLHVTLRKQYAYNPFTKSEVGSTHRLRSRLRLLPLRLRSRLRLRPRRSRPPPRRSRSRSRPPPRWLRPLL